MTAEPLNVPELEALRHTDRYPRSSTYDPQWIIDNRMGPNPLWQCERLVEDMVLAEGQRVLDLGCGKALTSIFLAEQFGVEVWAVDLWIPAEDNQRRIDERGLSDQVHALNATAHDLPLQQNFFDAIVSIDAYHYFGTADTYLPYIVEFLKPGGSLAVTGPGVRSELDGAIPAHLAPYWTDGFWSFHTAEWWQNHLNRHSSIAIAQGTFMTDGWQDWLAWSKASLEFGAELPFDPGQRWNKAEIEMLEADQGDLLGFVQVTATRSPDQASAP